MKIIYLDSDYRCHITNNGMMNAVETDVFDNKCDTFIEGYRFIPADESWTRDDGEVFHGEMITPWKDYSELDEAQVVYDRQLLLEYKSELAELDAIFLEQQYNSLMEDL